MENMNELSKKDLRFVKHVFTLSDNKLFDAASQILKGIGYNDDEIHGLWITMRTDYLRTRPDYNQMKKPSRQDNKDIRVGSGNGNKYKIRYPRKCRKTAWKRFYKLFPELKPE